VLSAARVVNCSCCVKKMVSKRPSVRCEELQRRSSLQALDSVSEPPSPVDKSSKRFHSVDVLHDLC
jgi:hypothetical protein